MLNSGNAIFSAVWSINREIKRNPPRRKLASVNFEESEFEGLPLGEYEDKRIQLIKERNSDYNKYLREKEKQLELKRLTRKLQYRLNNNIESNFYNSYNMLTSNNIFGFTSAPYGQNRNGTLQFDSKKIKDDYRKALEQQMEEQRKRKEMEKLQEIQSAQLQSLYQPSFIDGNAHRRPYLMKQESSPTSAVVSQSPTSIDLSNQLVSPVSSTITTKVTPVLPPTISVPSLITNGNSGLIFESETFNSKKKEYYRDDLKQQIEEKRRRMEEEKAKQQEEEERLAQRIEEQRLHMLQEYEMERQKKIQKEEELRKKQERLWQIQEQQRKEAEEARKLAYQKKVEAAQKLKMMNNLTPVSQTATNTQSTPPKIEMPPPVPQRSPTPPDPRTQVLNQLSQIRQQIHQEKKQKLEKLEQKKFYNVLDRPNLSSSSDSNNSEPENVF